MGQEITMRLQKFRAPGFRSGFPPIRFRRPSISATPKSLLAQTLSVECTISLGDFSPAAATPPDNASIASKVMNTDKKPKQDAALKGLPITELSADEAILHALNRLANGPRRGDIEHLRQMGLSKWIEQQLNPNSNSIDDKAVEARLQDYPTLRMSTT